MNVIIIGAGTVGSNIADYLSRDEHDIVVIDHSRERLAELSERLDVATLLGHGSDPAVIERAGAAAASLLLSLTSNDELNLMAAFTGKLLGVRRTVARVRRRAFLERSDLNFKSLLDIDLLLSPEVLTAQEIVKFVDNPVAFSVETYARGRVEMRRYAIAEECPAAHKTLRDLKIPAGALVVSIIRNDAVIIPTGADTIEPGDRVALLGMPRQIAEAQKLFSAEPHEAAGRQNVIIAGGGETGFYLAEILEERGHQIKLMDTDRERCDYLSERLKTVTVVHGDARSTPFLREERVGGADVFIATTGDDETNVMSSLLARSLGVEKTCCLVSRPDYLPVVEKTGIDLALSPRLVTANKVMSLVRRGRIRSLSILEEGKAEIVEFQVPRGSAVANHSLKEIPWPSGCLVATIVHKGQVQTPRGASVVRAGDILIIVGLHESIDTVEDLLSPPREAEEES